MTAESFARGVNLEELKRTYTSIQILLQASMEQIYPLCCKTNYVVIMRFCRETRCDKFMRFFRLLKNIVYRVHIAILAKYRVHTAQTLQKDIAQG